MFEIPSSTLQFVSTAYPNSRLRGGNFGVLFCTVPAHNLVKNNAAIISPSKMGVFFGKSMNMSKRLLSLLLGRHQMAHA